MPPPDAGSPRMSSCSAPKGYGNVFQCTMSLTLKVMPGTILNVEFAM